MNQKIKVSLAAVVVLVIAGVISQTILSNPPKAKERAKPPQKARLVEVQKLQPSNYQVKLKAFGRVSSPGETTLSSQVSGQVKKIGENFKAGGQVIAGELLLQIDDADYLNSLTQAKAELAKAEADLATEQAQSKQALDDWRAINGNRTPDPLVAREPQLIAARAAVSSAKARVNQAEINLRRTTVLAPFDGIVQSRSIGPGQYINAGSQLANLFSTDKVEVALPINNRDLNLLALPPQASPTVQLFADFDDFTASWQGVIVRSSGMIDSQNRQLSLIGEVVNPYQIERGDGKRKMPLLVGQFVEAEIAGRELKNVFVIPTAALYQGNQVWLLQDKALQARNVRVLHSNNGLSVIKGVNHDELLVISPVSPDVVSGTAARSKTQQVQQANAPSGEGKGKGNKQGKGQRKQQEADL